MLTTIQQFLKLAEGSSSLNVPLSVTAHCDLFFAKSTELCPLLFDFKSTVTSAIAY